MGAGRPKGRSKDELLMIRLEADLLEKSKQAAIARGISLSEWVRDLLFRSVGGRRSRPRRPKTSRSKRS
jgi:predicted HicB family RNase H-like nuclease